MGVSDVTSKLNDVYSVAPASKQGSGKPVAAGQTLSEEEKQQVQKLKKRDAEVRAHEAAHVAAGGQFVRGGASYTYQKGPDGQRYAVGGEVSIDVSPISGDPKATITKMQVVKRAAMAPANPSGADQSVAAAAASAELRARQELMDKKAVSGSGVPTETNSNNIENKVEDEKSMSFVLQKIVAGSYFANSHRSGKNSFFPAKAIVDLSA